MSHQSKKVQKKSATPYSLLGHRRTKKIAATVAALGAAIGVNLGDVLAESPNVQDSEIGKAAISSQKVKKPDVTSPKVERSLKRQPSASANKAIAPGLEIRPDVRANKAAPMIEKRPSAIGAKVK